MRCDRGQSKEMLKGLLSDYVSDYVSDDRQG